jgi:hypothetical protein
LDQTLFSSSTQNFLCGSLHAEDLTSKFVDSNAVTNLVNSLPSADPRVNSPSLTILYAIHEKFPNLREKMIQSLISVSHECCVQTRTNSNKAYNFEIEILTNENVDKQTRNQGQSMLELLVYILQRHKLLSTSETLELTWEKLFSDSLRILCLNLKCRVAVLAISQTDQVENEVNHIKNLSKMLALMHFPQSNSMLLGSLCRSWPTDIANLEIIYLDIIYSVIKLVQIDSIKFSQDRTIVGLLRRLSTCVQSQKVEIFQAAIKIVLLPAFLNAIYIQCPMHLTTIRVVLAKNRNHWSPVVREMSEQIFDSLLDFC